VEPAAFLARLERALAAGVRRVQLRVRGLPPGDMAGLARAAAVLCRPLGAELLVNGEPGLAADLGLGLHLPARALMALSSLPAVADGQRVAASCHDEDELARAEQLGVHFAVLGPVRATESHPGAEPLGWERFSLLREGVSLPIYAIGGMKPADVAAVRRHGGQGVAGIRGLWPR
jgi:8-oxo-dGTP diphosphatase